VIFYLTNVLLGDILLTMVGILFFVFILLVCIAVRLSFAPKSERDFDNAKVSRVYCHLRKQKHSWKEAPDGGHICKTCNWEAGQPGEGGYSPY